MRTPKTDLTGQPRRLAACMNCGETNEIAAFGMCFRCYRRMQREREAAAAGRRIDRHVGKRQKRENQIVHGLGQIMAGLTAMGVPDADRLRFRALLEPFLQPVKHLLGGPPLSPWAATPGTEEPEELEPDEEDPDCEQ